MKRRIYFFALLFSVITSLLHVVGMEFSLYENIFWFDVPMHFLAGAMVSLVLFGIALSLIDTRKRIWLVVLGTLVVGVAWEVFEYASALEFVREGYYFDTLFDIVIDLCGMLLGLYLGSRIQRTIIKK